ncbi:MAG: oxidoreductase [Candidatus Scalindua rubra]|uniref:Oxidoreductase n=1 Tax=Candidatus Scalindua rubra TaxID=1872076 RepID=A0A1E3X4B1_9BACT|nr:MAG: oxidoreductase [Candidatus Scalindua rubra]
MFNINMKEKDFKVLLINCNTMMDVLLPVGLSLISACLKEKGFEVKLFDTTFYKISKETGDEIRAKTLQVRKTNPEEFGLMYKDTDLFEDLKEMIEEYSPDIIGLSCIECTYELGIKMLKSIRHYNIPLIVGGVYATFAPEYIIAEDCVDMVCVGEGEYALVELCTKIVEEQDITSIKNIWIKKDGKIFRNGIREPVNIDELPFQDWSIFDPKRFYKPMGGKISMTGTFEMNRGCPYNCGFCSDYGLNKLYANNGGYYREKSIKRLIDEMKKKKEEYNLQFAYLVAESFLTTKRERIIEFIKSYKEVDIPFWIEARPESINEENVSLLESAGCEGISIGIESGNLNLRRELLDRNMTDETIIKTFKILERSSLRVSANNIIGFPTETREQIFETIELNRQMNAPGVMVSLYNPYKGTALREYCEEEGLIQKGSLAGDYRSETVLNMPQLSREELLGLQRTFPLYVRFPKSEWPRISKCEGNGQEAEILYKELSREYTEKFL